MGPVQHDFAFNAFGLLGVQILSEVPYVLNSCDSSVLRLLSVRYTRAALVARLSGAGSVAA